MTQVEKTRRRRAFDNALQPASNPQAQETELEVDLVELFYALLDKIKLIIACTLLGVLLGVLYTFLFVTPVYEATAMLYVVSSNDSAINLSDLQLGSYLAQDYQLMFKTWELHELVARNLALDYSYAQLAGMVSVTNPTNTRVLSISAKSTSPLEAKQLANEYAQVVKKRIAQVMSTEEPNDMSIALEPTQSITPGKAHNGLLTGLLFAIAAIGIVAVHFILDDKYKTEADILKYLDLPTFAMIPRQLSNASRIPQVTKGAKK